MTFHYLTVEDAIDMHRRTIEVSGGGALGKYDLGVLDSVLQHIQNDEYYPTLACKLTHLFFCACKFHCFQDGNKRIAIVLCVQMLSLNGYLRSLKGFMLEAENISYHVSKGSIEKELLAEWMTAILHGREDDESLKLKVLRAIAEGQS